MTGRSAPARSRRWRAALLVPLALALGCLRRGRARSTPSSRRAREAQTIQDLVGPVFLIAGIVFVLVQGGVLVPRLEVPQAQGRRRQPPAASSTATSSSRSAGRSSRPSCSSASASPRCSPSSTSRSTRPTPWRSPSSASSGGGSTVRRRRRRHRRHLHRQRPRDPRRRRPSSLTIQSRDVIHSFWIPALNGKRDAVPGREHPLLIEADEPGVYRGQCTEFCGLSHAYMRMRVVALAAGRLRGLAGRTSCEGAAVPAGERGRRRAWSCSAPPARSATSSTGPGGNEELREEDGIEGAALVAGAAPNLTHFASRGIFAGAHLRPLGRRRRQRRDRRRRDRRRAACSTWPTSRSGCATRRPRSRWPPASRAACPTSTSPRSRSMPSSPT